MTFSTLSDFATTHRYDCGEYSHTCYLTRFADNIVSLAVFDDETTYGFNVSLNTPSTNLVQKKMALAGTTHFLKHTL